MCCIFDRTCLVPPTDGVTHQQEKIIGFWLYYFLSERPDLCRSDHTVFCSWYRSRTLIYIICCSNVILRAVYYILCVLVLLPSWELSIVICVSCPFMGEPYDGLNKCFKMNNPIATSCNLCLLPFKLMGESSHGLNRCFKMNNPNLNQVDYLLLWKKTQI